MKLDNFNIEEIAKAEAEDYKNIHPDVDEYNDISTIAIAILIVFLIITGFVFL